MATSYGSQAKDISSIYATKWLISATVDLLTVNLHIYSVGIVKLQKLFWHRNVAIVADLDTGHGAVTSEHFSK